MFQRKIILNQNHLNQKTFHDFGGIHSIRSLKPQGFCHFLPGPSEAPKLLTQEELEKGEEGLVADEAPNRHVALRFFPSEIESCWVQQQMLEGENNSTWHVCLFVTFVCVFFLNVFFCWYLVIERFGEVLFMTISIGVLWHVASIWAGSGGHRWSKYNDTQRFHLTSLWLFSNFLGILG